MTYKMHVRCNRASIPPRTSLPRYAGPGHLDYYQHCVVYGLLDKIISEKTHELK